jgi:hypothetical protein
MTREPAASAPAPKFDEEFIERRMRAHREWQEARARELESDVVAEIVAALSPEHFC